MQRIAFRLYAIVVVCVCVCVYVCAAFVGLRKTVWDEDVVFVLNLRGITPDIIYKSLTQIGLQIPRWRKNGGRKTL